MHLEHFVKSEFREWWQRMSHRLLVLADVLRHQLGSAIEPSKNKAALGRNGGNSESAHNIDRWGEVLAMDFFVSGVYFRAQAEEVVDRMRKIGFTGIGVYTGTRNNRGELQVMFHGDVRPDRKMGDPAVWGRINGKMTTLMAALQSLPTKGEEV